MSAPTYDVVVVGTRCAGAPTAMLLARAGYRVLALDRGHFPSDTLSTHLVHPPGVAALARWGLLDALVATGCPPIDTYRFDFGPFALTGAPGTPDAPVAYAPRRTVLDALLVEAAARAGAEVREGFTVEDVVVEDGTVVGVRGHDVGGGTSVVERARVVVGADGRHSRVAARVQPEHYRDAAPLLVGYYSYWSGLPMDGRVENYVRPDRGFAAWPTHDDLTLVIGGWPYAELEANRRDVAGSYVAMFDLAPEFADRVRSARREDRVVGTAVASWFRRPYGPGWALVGDAGYNKDFITAQGITDAFRDAELCAAALDAALSGRQAYSSAMAGYQSTRDAHVDGMYDLTLQFASLQPPPDELARLLAAMEGHQPAMDGFAQVNAGVLAPSAFFAEDNLDSLLASA